MRFEMTGFFIVVVDGNPMGYLKLFEDAEDCAVGFAEANRNSSAKIFFPVRPGEPEALAGDYSYGSDDWNDYHG